MQESLNFWDSERGGRDPLDPPSGSAYASRCLIFDRYHNILCLYVTIFKQTICFAMGPNCEPLLADIQYFYIHTTENNSLNILLYFNVSGHLSTSITSDDFNFHKVHRCMFKIGRRHHLRAGRMATCNIRERVTLYYLIRSPYWPND